MLWGVMWNYLPEPFSEAEKDVLSRYFTNFDKPVFALINLPEVVKGALFARYSRSAKSLRRLFLDEFYDQMNVEKSASDAVGVVRAEKLYERMLTDYGDDSVAQLGGVHLACEQASNLLTKFLERGRLMAYLEQSTRYVPYDKKREDGHFRYFIPSEIIDGGMEPIYRTEMDALFTSYSEILGKVESRLFATTPKDPQDSDFVHNSSVRAVALDATRGILPASVLSNVGIFGSAQGFESLILRLRASAQAESRAYAELIKTELDKVIPAFLTRLDRPERGGVWTDYLSKRANVLEGFPRTIVQEPSSWSDQADEVSVKLVDFDPMGERKVAASIIFANSKESLAESYQISNSLTESELANLFERYVGERTNRRHKPGRAFEMTSYLFEVECDYGAFRDLQRHRMLSVEWQDLGTNLGYVTPELIVDFDLEQDYQSVLDSAEHFYNDMVNIFGAKVASYAVPMAFRIRFSMEMNAREAMHLIELRSSPQGHTTYRKVAQKMYECIGNIANHYNVTKSMKHVDMDHYRLGRLSSLRQEEKKAKKISK